MHLPLPISSKETKSNMYRDSWHEFFLSFFKLDKCTTLKTGIVRNILFWKESLISSISNGVLNYFYTDYSETSMQQACKRINTTIFFLARRRHSRNELCVSAHLLASEDFSQVKFFPFYLNTKVYFLNDTQ